MEISTQVQFSDSQDASLSQTLGLKDLSLPGSFILAFLSVLEAVRTVSINKDAPAEFQGGQKQSGAGNPVTGLVKAPPLLACFCEVGGFGGIRGARP